MPLEGVDTWLAEIDLVFLLEARGAALIIGRRTDFSKQARRRWRSYGFAESEYITITGDASAIEPCCDPVS